MRLSRLIVPCVVLLASAPAWAGITALTGVTQLVGGPTLPLGGDNDLTQGELESDTTAYIWYEGTSTIGTAFTIEHHVHNTAAYTVNANSARTPGQINTGLTVDSYLFHFDKIGTAAGVFVTLTNLSITFAEQIIGVAVTDGGTATDAGVYETDDGSGNASGNAFQGPSPLTYTDMGARGFELGTGATQDRFQISADRRTITILNVSTEAVIDHLRILVNPEPSSLALTAAGIAGLAGLVAVRRRRRPRAGAGR